ncbi:uncharacterized protein PAC_11892 [Phialocephala subalpina]|uniref:Uncharacterized protein n=1 Tax=Phialocephala subalpina TaxID=576137 RepID=A0A1L7XAF3_9HELO|nr:uncharacterized protein PAC_11892 [Phialocephala subalpina]
MYQDPLTTSTSLALLLTLSHFPDSLGVSQGEPSLLHLVFWSTLPPKTLGPTCSHPPREGPFITTETLLLGPLQIPGYIIKTTVKHELEISGAQRGRQPRSFDPFSSTYTPAIPACGAEVELPKLFATCEESNMVIRIVVSDEFSSWLDTVKSLIVQQLEKASGEESTEVAEEIMEVRVIETPAYKPSKGYYAFTRKLGADPIVTLKEGDRFSLCVNLLDNVDKFPSKLIKPNFLPFTQKAILSLRPYECKDRTDPRYDQLAEVPIEAMALETTLACAAMDEIHAKLEEVPVTRIKAFFASIEKATRRAINALSNILGEESYSSARRDLLSQDLKVKERVNIFRYMARQPDDTDVPAFFTEKQKSLRGAKSVTALTHLIPLLLSPRVNTEGKVNLERCHHQIVYTSNSNATAEGAIEISGRRTVGKNRPKILFTQVHAEKTEKSVLDMTIYQNIQPLTPIIPFDKEIGTANGRANFGHQFCSKEECGGHKLHKNQTITTQMLRNCVSRWWVPGPDTRLQPPRYRHQSEDQVQDRRHRMMESKTRESGRVEPWEESRERVIQKGKEPLRVGLATRSRSWLRSNKEIKKDTGDDGRSDTRFRTIPPEREVEADEFVEASGDINMLDIKDKNRSVKAGSECSRDEQILESYLNRFATETSENEILARYVGEATISKMRAEATRATTVVELEQQLQRRAGLYQALAEAASDSKHIMQTIHHLPVSSTQIMMITGIDGVCLQYKSWLGYEDASKHIRQMLLVEERLSKENINRNSWLKAGDYIFLLVLLYHLKQAIFGMEVSEEAHEYLRLLDITMLERGTVPRPVATDIKRR